MFEGFSFETVAHYTRGMATMFFIMQVVLIYNLRKRDRMTYILFVTITYITLCYIKDVVFLFTPWMQNRFVEDLTSIIDITCTPFVCAYFYEATNPGVVKRRHLIFFYILFATFIPFYCVLQDVRVMYVAASASALVCIVTMILTLLNAIRYKKCLDDNYSYTKDISVRWIVKSAFVYILWFFFYSLCFNPTTWFGEAVFDIASIIFWTTLCLLNHSHRVITEMLHKDDVGNEYVAEEEANDNGDAEKRATAEPPMDGEAAEMSSDDEQLRERDAFMATALKYCMENKKLYLNPRLTITDLAHVMRSNKSYISDYVNRRGKTFYDFINEYRISEACRIIETKGVHEKISMSDIALRSGFNSMSSFNRYFSKIKGVSPSSYIRQHEQE